MQGMTSTEYDVVWATKWDDMKKYGPFSRHLRRLLMEMIGPLQFETVLDVGCGQGALLAEIQERFPHVRLHGTEISATALEMTQARLPTGSFWLMDLTEDYQGERFDLVICSEVLEHIPDDVTAIRNLARMTNKYLIVSSPQGRMRDYEVAEVGHVRNYAYGELVQKLEQAGMRATRVIEWGFPFYSPLYRDFLNRTRGRGTTGHFGAGRKLLAQLLYYLFALNSSRRGDEIVVLAEPAGHQS